MRIGSGKSSTMRNFIVCNVYLVKPTGKRPLGRPRRRWEDNSKKHLNELGVSTRNEVDSAQDRDYWIALVNAALNHRVP